MSKIMPYGDRILVKRRIIGEKTEGGIIMPDVVKDRMTDLADVVYVPDLTLGDKAIMDNAEAIVEKLTDKAKNGNIDAVKSLLSMNEYLKIKAIKPGDKVMISKYTGTDFHETGSTATLTLVLAQDIIGMVCDE